MLCSFLCSESNCDHVVQYGIHFDRLQWASWSSANDTTMTVCWYVFISFPHGPLVKRAVVNTWQFSFSSFSSIIFSHLIV